MLLCTLSGVKCKIKHSGEKSGIFYILLFVYESHEKIKTSNELGILTSIVYIV